MNSAGLRRVLIRRWYLVLVGILMTFGLTYAASLAVPVKYEADAAVVLLPPSDPTSNPYLGLAGYSSFADVFARAVMDTTQVAALKSQGVTDPFTVQRDLTTSAPIIRVAVTGSGDAPAVRQMQIVLDTIPGELVTIQQNANVPTAAMFRSKVITQAEHATPIRKSQLRAMIAAGAVGVLITVWGTVWIDSLLVRRAEKVRSRHRVERGDSDEDPTDRRRRSTDPPAGSTDEDPTNLRRRSTDQPAASPNDVEQIVDDGKFPDWLIRQNGEESIAANGAAGAARSTERVHAGAASRSGRRRRSQGGRV